MSYKRTKRSYINKSVITTAQTLTASNTVAGSALDPVEGHLTPIVEGEGPNKRFGRRIIIKKIRIEGTITARTITNANIGSTNGTRLLVVVDTQPSSPFDPNEVLEEFAGNAIASQRDMDNYHRYVVLSDTVVTVPPRSAVQLAPLRGTIKLNDDMASNGNANFSGLAPTDIGTETTNGGPLPAPEITATTVPGSINYGPVNAALSLRHEGSMTTDVTDRLIRTEEVKRCFGLSVNTDIAQSYKGSGGGATDVASNRLHLMAITDDYPIRHYKIAYSCLTIFEG